MEEAPCIEICMKKNIRKKFMLTQAVEYGNDPEAPIKLTILENEIDEAT